MAWPRMASTLGMRPHQAGSPLAGGILPRQRCMFTVSTPTACTQPAQEQAPLFRSACRLEPLCWPPHEPLVWCASCCAGAQVLLAAASDLALIPHHLRCNCPYTDCQVGDHTGSTLGGLSYSLVGRSACVRAQQPFHSSPARAAAGLMRLSACSWEWLAVLGLLCTAGHSARPCAHL